MFEPKTFGLRWWRRQRQSDRREATSRALWYPVNVFNSTRLASNKTCLIVFTLPSCPTIVAFALDSSQAALTRIAAGSAEASYSRCPLFTTAGARSCSWRCQEADMWASWLGGGQQVLVMELSTKFLAGQRMGTGLKANFIQDILDMSCTFIPAATRRNVRRSVYQEEGGQI